MDGVIVDTEPSLCLLQTIWGIAVTEAMYTSFGFLYSQYISKIKESVCNRAGSRRFNTKKTKHL
jgi:hypothetical protein